MYSARVILCRAYIFGFIAAVFGTGLGACHEPISPGPNSEAGSRASSATPTLERRAPESPAEPPLQPTSVESASAPRPEGSLSRAVEQPASPRGEQTVAGITPAVESNSNPTPELFDSQAQPLGQTEQRPTLSSVSFKKRVAAVAQAIVSGETEAALDAFFPLLAYQQVKDVAKPERDYKFRLVANFKRDLLEYHRALGASAAEARLQEIVVPEQSVKWMAPGSEGNKLGYFRVLRSRLRFTLPTGRTREFELTSMISWRGEWYVVHLHGFK